MNFFKLAKQQQISYCMFRQVRTSLYRLDWQLVFICKTNHVDSFAVKVKLYVVWTLKFSY